MVKSSAKSPTKHLDAGDADLNVQLNRSRLVTDSIRSLQRYQNVLDKMFDGSIKRKEEKNVRDNSIIHP